MFGSFGKHISCSSSMMIEVIEEQLKIVDKKTDKENITRANDDA